MGTAEAAEPTVRMKETSQATTTGPVSDDLKEYRRQFDAARAFEDEDNEWWKTTNTTSLSTQGRIVGQPSLVSGGAQERSYNSPFKAATVKTLDPRVTSFPAHSSASISSAAGIDRTAPYEYGVIGSGKSVTITKHDSPLVPTKSTLNAAAPKWRPQAHTLPSAGVSARKLAVEVPTFLPSDSAMPKPAHGGGEEDLQKPECRGDGEVPPVWVDEKLT